ncbi:zinc-dependent metalloprotease [Aquihabitans sp. G128]|uniref:zinc-dependent metalloprotease n=1 Tax=Aquihabitans sp. G128 TaxID=2849779 RepID=UPI001C22876E|nr:zinc-dependent metalloprotease [Aquihabitans sp. G128]QXC59278.1 zinc-dependent metalloprotease [Aquihabitans sp. G128]
MGAVDWGLAEKVAVRAAGREPFADSYHYASLSTDFEELTSLAEDQVAAATGLRSLSGNARARVTDRQGWVRANIASFQRLLRPITDKLDALSTSPLAPVASRVAGAEMGMMLGWMSSRVLGQYDLLVVEDENPDDQDIVYYVGPNILGLEKRFAFPPREFRHWLALHEVTHRAQFTGIPWMRQHFLGLVQETVGSVDPDPKHLTDALGRLAGDLRSGKNPLDDGGIMAILASPEQRLVLDRVAGLMSLLEGHGDVTMDRAGADQIPSAERFGQVLRQRRQQGNPAAKLLQKLIGLDAKMKQYEQGEAFIEVVEKHGGTELLDVAWVDPGNLPSIAEIRDPDLWIARVGPVVAA